MVQVKVPTDDEVCGKIDESLLFDLKLEEAGNAEDELATKRQIATDAERSWKQSKKLVKKCRVAVDKARNKVQKDNESAASAVGGEEKDGATAAAPTSSPSAVALETAEEDLRKAEEQELRELEAKNVAEEELREASDLYDAKKKEVEEMRLQLAGPQPRKKKPTQRLTTDALGKVSYKNNVAITVQCLTKLNRTVGSVQHQRETTAGVIFQFSHKGGITGRFESIYLLLLFKIISQIINTLKNNYIDNINVAKFIICLL
jgi:hypothetical protein